MDPRASENHAEAVRRLFDEFVELTPEEREEQVAAVGDAALKTEVCSLLNAHDRADDEMTTLDELHELLSPSAPQGDLYQRSDPYRLVGQRIRKYEVTEHLGGGGMGVVYKARDTNLDRPVALKFLPPHLLASPEAEERFVREAKAAAALDHPNIGYIHEISKTEFGRRSQRFIAMAYYKGETLKEKLARDGPLPYEEVVKYGVQIAEGLARAHGAGIVHRDVKPANLMVTEEGTVKIVDFGLARAADQSRLTQTGQALGTVAYMSPEQARGDSIDASTDLWALGVVLYEMITGRRPFRGDRSTAVLHAILHETPAPIGEHREGVPPALQHIIERCLRKAPEARYSTAAELGSELRRVSEMIAEDNSITTPRVLPRPLRDSEWGRLIASGVAGVLLLGLALWMVFPTLKPHMEPLGLTGLTDGFPTGVDHERRMVVLPCRDDDPDRAFCTGFMATLTDRLLQTQRPLGVWVVPADEVRRRGATTPDEARRWYNADLVVTGTTDREVGTVGVHLTLLDGAERKEMGTTLLESPAANATVLQREAIGRLAGMLGVEFGMDTLGGTITAGTAVPGAYEAYLQGRGALWESQEGNSLDAAVEAFQRAIDEDPVYARAHAALGESYRRTYEATQDTQWIAKAEQHSVRALLLSDQLVSAHETLGLLHRSIGQHEEAAHAFQRALVLQPDRPDIYRHLAAAYTKQDSLEKAESVYQEVVYRWPDYWVGYRNLGAFYKEQGRFEAAVTQWRQAVAVAPENFRTHSNLALLYFMMGRRDQARKRYERLLEIKPNFGAYSNLGTIYFDDGRYADARQMYEKALDLNSTDYRLWGNLADALYWGGAREQARTHYRKAVKLAEGMRKAGLGDARLVDVLCHLSGYYAMLNAPEKALSRIDRALTLAPNAPQVAYFAAKIYAQLGRREAALNWTEKALERGIPPAYVERDIHLRHLRGDPRFRDLLTQYHSSS